jgi:hypothetical protein
MNATYELRSSIIPAALLVRVCEIFLKTIPRILFVRGDGDGNLLLTNIAEIEITIFQIQIKKSKNS